MNYSDNAINRWEELLFCFFNESLLNRNELFTFDLPGYTTHELVWIIPSENTMKYLSTSLGKWGLDPSTDVVKEFQKEISARLCDFPDYSDKMRYIEVINKKFKNIFNRLPIYYAIRTALLPTISKNSEPGGDYSKGRRDFRIMIDLGRFMSKISEVDIMLDSITNIYKETLEDVQQLFIESNSNLQGSEHLNVPLQNNEISLGKLKFTCQPAIVGYIFQQLILKGYLEAPQRTGGWNVSETGRILFNTFEFSNGTLETLQKELSENSNSLSRIKQALLKLPYSQDLK